MSHNMRFLLKPRFFRTCTGGRLPLAWFSLSLSRCSSQLLREAGVLSVSCPRERLSRKARFALNKRTHQRTHGSVGLVHHWWVATREGARYEQLGLFFCLSLNAYPRCVSFSLSLSHCVFGDERAPPQRKSVFSVLDRKRYTYKKMFFSPVFVQSLRSAAIPAIEIVRFFHKSNRPWFVDVLP